MSVIAARVHYTSGWFGGTPYESLFRKMRTRWLAIIVEISKRSVQNKTPLSDSVPETRNEFVALFRLRTCVKQAEINSLKATTSKYWKDRFYSAINSSRIKTVKTASDLQEIKMITTWKLIEFLTKGLTSVYHDSTMLVRFHNSVVTIMLLIINHCNYSRYRAFK